MRTVLCPRLSMLARVPPHAMETREEQNIWLEKIRVKKKDKKINVFNRFDWIP